MLDYPGHLAGVMFTSGCNFRCGFCHNARLLADRRHGLPWDRLESRCREWRDHWVDAVVVSGGEPTLSEGLEALIDFLKGFGFFVKLDTNGSRPEVLGHCLPKVDYVAMDVKTGLSRYGEVTGFDDVESIRRSVELIRRHARDYEFRTTVVPRLHGESDMEEIGTLIRGARRYIMQPFVPQPDLLSAEFSAMDRPLPGHLHKLAELVRHSVDEVQVRDRA